MSIPFIDLASQQARIRKAVSQRLEKVLDHGQYINGPEIVELEESLAKYVGVEHAIGVSSGTDALLMALMALGVKAGDEVITTPFTFIATGEVIALLGAIPVFVDIDPQTYNVCPLQVKQAITEKTAAIMPVSIFGQCADLDEINKISTAHGIPVIEDAAQSFGAESKGRRSCSMTTISATSFFPSKPLGCYGDGGACFTNDAALAATLRHIRDHGQDRRYHHERLGINGRLDTMQATILIEKLKIFDDEVAARQRIGEKYSTALKDFVRTPQIIEGNSSVYAQYTIEVPDRESFCAAMQEAGVPTAVHYPIPLNRQPALDSFNRHPTPIADQVASRVVSLPMHPYLTESDQTAVITAVKAAL